MQLSNFDLICRSAEVPEVWQKFYNHDRPPGFVWLHNLKDPISRLARMRIGSREYNYRIIHRAGRINSNTDALSQNPVITPQEASGENENIDDDIDVTEKMKTREQLLKKYI